MEHFVANSFLSSGILLIRTFCYNLVTVFYSNLEVLSYLRFSVSALVAVYISYGYIQLFMGYRSEKGRTVSKGIAAALTGLFIHYLVVVVLIYILIVTTPGLI